METPLRHRGVGPSSSKSDGSGRTVGRLAVIRSKSSITGDSEDLRRRERHSTTGASARARHSQTARTGLSGGSLSSEASRRLPGTQKTLMCVKSTTSNVAIPDRGDSKRGERTSETSEDGNATPRQGRRSELVNVRQLGPDCRAACYRQKRVADCR